MVAVYGYLSPTDAARHVASVARPGAFDRPAPFGAQRPAAPVRLLAWMTSAIAHLLHDATPVVAPA